MGKVHSELTKLGFQETRPSNWVRGHDFVQIVHSSERHGVRITWREEWKDYLAVIFDYTEAEGPICIVPTRIFFDCLFVSIKRREKSYANSGFYWSQLFPFSETLPQMVLSYENRWDVVGGKAGASSGWPIFDKALSKAKKPTRMIVKQSEPAEDGAEPEFRGMLKAFKDVDLMHLYSDFMEELRSRGVVRSGNNPVSDYAEKIVAEQLNLKLAIGSNKGYDAIDEKTGVKYQIKSRRLTSHNSSRQLGVFRNLDQRLFDFLIAVIFTESFETQEIWQIPIQIISRYARTSKHQNGQILILTGEVLQDKEVKRLL